MPDTDKNQILSELNTMRVRMDELYTESFGEKPSCNPSSDSRSETWEPLADVWESEKEWLLVLDLPGVLEGDLHVEVNEDRLTVWGQRCRPSVPDSCMSLKKERRAGAFSRAFQLPRYVQGDHIKAELKRGVLTVTIPRNADSIVAAHRIKVNRD